MGRAGSRNDAKQAVHNFNFAIPYIAKKLRQPNPKKLADAYHSDLYKYTLVDDRDFTLLDEETGNLQHTYACR